MVLPNPELPTTPLQAKKNITGTKRDILETPLRSQQVYSLTQNSVFASNSDPTTRLLFQKINKGLNNKNTELAAAQVKIQELEHVICRLKPRKRQKVAKDPNDRFVNIEGLMKSRARLQEALDPVRMSEMIAEHEFEHLCFEWQLELA